MSAVYSKFKLESTVRMTLRDIKGVAKPIIIILYHHSG